MNAPEKYLNIGCGGVRPALPWVNLDCLRSVLNPGTPERANLDKEENYIDHNIESPLPFADGEFSAVMASHVLEHFDCRVAASIVSECRRILVGGGSLFVSVPNASYFLNVLDEDTKENAERLFGEPIHDPQHKSFFDYALWYHEHKQIYCPDSLVATFVRGGFRIRDVTFWKNPPPPFDQLANRKMFSVMAVAKKL